MKLLALFTVALVASSAQAGSICEKLQARLEKGEVLDVTIELPSVNDVFDSPSILSIKDKSARRLSMISTLKERTAAARQPFVQILTSLGLGGQRSIQKPIWISNRFEVKSADLALVQVLARVPGEFTIREPKTAHIIDPLPGKPVEVSQQNDTQWGVEMIDAPAAWNISRGEGVIVGIIDTGVYLDHEGLKDAYAGAWEDPYYNTPTPDDTQSHGTHCMGSVLGRTRGTGVAPAATWIACRGLDNSGSGYESDLLGCAQWMLDGADPLPHIVTNSWGGGSGDVWYNDAMRAWIVADIIPVFALGNSGSSCGSANSPGDQNYCIGVGSTDINDEVSYFSSRGPTRYMLKPEVSAPGEDIVSCGNMNPTQYTTKSGTSMATPHTAGAIALILSVNPDMGFNEVMDLLKETGDHPPVSQTDIACGDGQEWPNNAFGHGRINCLTALTSMTRA